MAFHHELDHLDARAKAIYLIGQLNRHGCLTFLTRLEYELYHPDTDATDAFTVFHTQYNNCAYYIIEIPASDYVRVNLLAQEVNLKFVGGKPHRLGTEPFRLNCADTSCFTLEYITHVPDDPAKLNDEYDKVQTYLRRGLAI
jgi:hypothetical protein